MPEMTNKAHDNDGRTMAEAATAGDSFKVETSDGKAALWMPGCVGVDQTLVAARKHWRSRLGQMVKIWRVLPGSGIGCMYLEDAGQAAL